MKNIKKIWNATFNKCTDEEIVYDKWLDQYQTDLLNTKTQVLDLGCGTGNDTLYLIEKGFDVVACDYSKVVLDILKNKIPKAKTKNVDVTKKLPFPDNSFDVIIADLVLHFFNDKTTKNIMKEIRRILTEHGVLLARVNSLADTNYEDGQGKKVEDNFYFVDGHYKRFFSTEDVQKYFSIIGQPEAKQAEMLRYSKPKQILEVRVVKKQY